LSNPTLAGDDDAPRGPAVTVLKAAKSCFANIVEVSGIILARDETAVRAERFGLKVADVLIEPGQSVTAGQPLARLNLPEGGSINVQSRVAGVVANSSAVVGAMASGKGEALFTINSGGDFDLVGLVPTADLAKLAVNQPATVRPVGALFDIDGKVRRI